MIKTRVTELLGIKYPILMGGMQWISFAEMAAAVANAGGMGFIPAASFEKIEDLRAEIRKAKDMTDGPVGMNISMLPEFSAGEPTMDYLEVGIEEKVSAFETAGRSPELLVSRVKESKIPLLHKVPQVRFAKKAESLGADAVIIVGFECGGHPGMADVTSMILINKASRELTVPVIAAGGIVCGKSLVAALALGAEGVIMGTRFMASDESKIHKNFKDWILNATENDTTILLRSIKNPMRVMDNETAKMVREIEARGTTLQEILTYASGKVGREAYASGDTEKGVIGVGEAVGLIDDIKSIKEIMEDVVAEAQDVLSRLNTIITNQKK
jgi:NAD(P)H-dependent flavin oxidoreductase YrpB (nitropropane dioxygenase family)